MEILAHSVTDEEKSEALHEGDLNWIVMHSIGETTQQSGQEQRNDFMIIFIQNP
jgi:hypothetical protein